MYDLAGEQEFQLALFSLAIINEVPDVFMDKFNDIYKTMNPNIISIRFHFFIKKFLIKRLIKLMILKMSPLEIIQNNFIN